MSVRKSEIFISDVEQQFLWYLTNANWEIADRYLDAVETSVHLLERHPQIGSVVGFSHLRLRHWRFIVVLRPFQNIFSFMKSQAITFCCAAPCMVTVIYRSVCLSHNHGKIL